MNKIARFMLCTMGVFCVSQYTLLLTSSIARAQLISEAPRLENEAEVLSPTPGMGTSTPERTRSIPV
ncbi:MAG: hypothetical protein SVX43_12795, partial [Cyanobacteriota bacterium]|nr:hypothetical protein [Cyanobacteriota bacterium]